LSELLKGIIPIEKKFMQNNNLFALEYREGYVFGRTMRRRILQYKPWPLLEDDGITAIDIAASTHEPEVRFRDRPRGSENDILYLSSTTKAGLPWFLHGAFGLKPQYMNMYLRFPEGDVIPGKFPNIGPIRPTAGDDISPLNGLVSPYEQPTDYHEGVIPPLEHIAAEYYNKDPDRSHNPVVNILFCLYWAQIFRPDTHPSMISNVAARRYPATFLTVGFGDHPHPMGEQMKDDWAIDPMTLDEAISLGGKY